jgi:hypothetical protein
MGEFSFHSMKNTQATRQETGDRGQESDWGNAEQVDVNAERGDVNAAWVDAGQETGDRGQETDYVNAGRRDVYAKRRDI